MKHRFFITLLAAVFSLPLFAADVKLTELTDLETDADRASDQDVPILVMFSASYCGYCSIVKDDFLKPMLLSGEYSDKVIIRVLEIDGDEDIRDIDGKLIDPADIAERYNVQLTPTLAFVGGDGKELSEKMIGLTTVDFYGGYLDESINRSLMQIRGNNTLSQRPLASTPRL